MQQWTSDYRRRYSNGALQHKTVGVRHARRIWLDKQDVDETRPEADERDVFQWKRRHGVA